MDWTLLQFKDAFTSEPGLIQRRFKLRQRECSMRLYSQSLEILTTCLVELVE
jgi:hypothetical protein